IIGLGLIAVAVVLLLRRRKEESIPHRPNAPSVAQSIELYRRLERALEARGVARALSTPPLTHARALVAAGPHRAGGARTHRALHRRALSRSTPQRWSGARFSRACRATPPCRFAVRPRSGLSVTRVFDG